MPSLTIPTPEQTNSTHQSIAPHKPPPIVPPGSFKSSPYPNQRSSSPVAPEFSPITPPSRPALPATYPPPELPGPEAPAGANTNGQHTQSPAPIIPPAEYIPQPPPQPFSSEDATDAIALRAAISSLQFQKKKAQDDIRELERIRKKALDKPEVWKTELVAGRLKEQKPQFGNLQAILDAAEGSDDEDEVVLGASREDDAGSAGEQNSSRNEPAPQTSSPPKPDSQASPAKDQIPPFGRIPGPQNVVRMPYVNWDKYHVAGDALDQLHEQQLKWPGSFGVGPKGREYAIAAPYSPWRDPLETQQGDAERRNDSVATPLTAVTPGSISEHPMETRRRQTFHQ